jgi:hypothetical protein
MDLCFYPAKWRRRPAEQILAARFTVLLRVKSAIDKSYKYLAIHNFLVTFGPPKVTQKLPAAIACGHGFPVRLHKNNASFASDFCDFSRTLEKPCYPSTN